MTLALTIVAGIVGFICLAGIGANDVANSQGMAVGSGAISLRGAQIIASICEFLGAALVGHHVSKTVGGKIVDIDHEIFIEYPEKYAWGMFSAILSTAIWMFLATYFKMPVSSTHSIIGALMGFQLVINNFDPSSEHWDQLGNIGISWIVTPFLSFSTAIILMYACDKWWPLLIIDNESLSKPLINSLEMTTGSIDIVSNVTDENVESEEINNETNVNDGSKPKKKTFDISQHFDAPTKPTPFKFAVIFAILWSTLILFVLAAGPKSIAILGLVQWWVFVIIGIGSLLLTMIIGYFIEPFYRKWYINKYYTDTESKEYKVFNNLDYFALYLVIASATVSFAHGGNDVANVLGPFGQIFAYQKDGKISKGASIPLWLAGMGGLAIGVGFVLFGKGVLETVGKGITDVTYQSGFIAQYSAALTVLVCDILALPVSSSTVIIGGVSGVAFYSATKENSIRQKMGKERKFTLQQEYDGMNVCGKCVFRLKRMNLKILLKIVGTWIITIPCNAAICAAVYAMMDAIFD